MLHEIVVECVPPGAVLRTVGETVRDLLIVACGVVEVESPGEPPRWGTGGAIIGMAESLLGAPSPASVTAIRHTRVARIPARAIWEQGGGATGAFALSQLTRVSHLTQARDEGLHTVPPDPLVIAVILVPIILISVIVHIVIVVLGIVTAFGIVHAGSFFFDVFTRCVRSVLLVEELFDLRTALGVDLDEVHGIGCAQFDHPEHVALGRWYRFDVGGIDPIRVLFLEGFLEFVGQGVEGADESLHGAHMSSTYAKMSGATIVASLSMMYFGVSISNLPQVIFSLGTAPL